MTEKEKTVATTGAAIPKPAAKSAATPAKATKAFNLPNPAADDVKKAIKSFKPAETPQETMDKLVNKAVAAVTEPETDLSIGGLWDEPLPPALQPRRSVIDPEQKVTVDGKPVSPIAVGLKSQGGYIAVDGVTAYLPYPNHRYEDLTFSAYYIGGNNNRNHDTLVLLDEFSTLTIDRSGPHGFGRMHNRRPSSVIMVNSSSKNDSYYGENFLINVDSEENSLNDTRLEAKGSVQGYSWEYGGNDESDYAEEHGSHKDKFVTGQSLRHRYVNSQFKKSTCIDSKLAEGYYSHCIIFRSTIKASGRCNLTRTEVKKSEVQGSDITLVSCNFMGCTINCEGSIYANSQRLRRESFNTTSLCLRNKFCQMEITLPRYNDLKMIRISENEVELVNSAMRSNFKVALNAVPYKIREHVVAFLKTTGPYGESGDVPNAFMDSMIEYVVDSVVSRLGMIAMLDAAQQATRALVKEEYTYDNPYGD